MPRGGGNSRIAIARSAEFPGGEQFPDRDREIGWILNGGNSGIVIARSAKFREGALPGSRSRDRPDSQGGGRFPGRDRAIGRMLGGEAIPGSRSRGRPNCWGGSNSRIAIARSAGFQKGGTSRIAIVRSAGSRSRDRPDSKGGQFPDRDRAIGQIPAEGTFRIAIPRWVGFRGGAVPGFV